MRFPAYAELHALSNYSFLRGASHPAELVERAAALGYAALALTDECSLAGVVRAHVAASEAGLALVIGAEICLDDGLRLVLLAPDRAADGRLATLITGARRAAPKGEYRIGGDEVAAGAEGCLAVLPGGGGVPPLAHARWLAECFPGRAWVAAELLRGVDDGACLRALGVLADAARLPLLAAGDVHMHQRSRRAVQDTLTAIRHRCAVAEAGTRLFSNGERHLRRRDQLARIYPAELLAETVQVASRCHFSLDELRYEYPAELVPEGLDASTHLGRLVEAGARVRWPAGTPSRVRALLDHELALIAELGYAP